MYVRVYVCTNVCEGSMPTHKWEDCETIDDDSWGFDRLSQLDNYKTPEELVGLLVRTVALGGNLLLNAGPRSDGVIDPIFEERLLALGAFLALNGQAVYATRPWNVSQNDSLNPLAFYTRPKYSNSTTPSAQTTPLFVTILSYNTGLDASSPSPSPSKAQRAARHPPNANAKAKAPVRETVWGHSEPPSALSEAAKAKWRGDGDGTIELGSVEASWVQKVTLLGFAAPIAFRALAPSGIALTLPAFTPLTAQPQYALAYVFQLDGNFPG